MISFSIIDNDVQTLHKISNMLEVIFAKHNFDAKLVCVTTDINNLFAYFNKDGFDVLILDIRLNSQLTDFEIAEKIRKQNKDCYFIFITAYFEYCFIAYKYKTFDFLIKPISLERLEECIVRLFDDIMGSYKKFVKLDNKNTIINERKINYIERSGMKLIFHTDMSNYEIYSSFNKIQQTLPINFVRCHKSFIANIHNITKIESTKNTVYFEKSFCDIGPKYKKEFMEVFKNYGNFD